MRYIDAFNHFNPKRYFDALLESPAGQKDIGKRVRGIPALYDLDLRLKVVEQFPDYTQVLSLGLPMIDRLWGPDKTPEMAKLANDGLAEVVAKNPEPFRRLFRGGADERAGRRREGGRARAQERRQRHPARHQRQRRADRRQGVLAALRGDREIRQADPAASGARARDAGLRRRGEIEIRDLQRARLALRDRRDAVALHLLQDHGHLSEPEGRLAPSRRRHSRISKAASRTRSTRWARAPPTRTTKGCARA